MIRKPSHRPGAALLQLGLVLTTLFLSADAFAVAGFARQTGMSCTQCHTSHGGATPHVTFTGKKVNALGYRDYERSPAKPPGTYRVHVGMYRPADGTRLNVLGPDGAPLADHVVLEQPLIVEIDD